MVEHIPDTLDPAHLHYLKAKSEDYGGDTLAQHTWAVLRRLADQYRLRPLLAYQLDDLRLWHRLYWGCFLHDFGKAASGFQELLMQPGVVNHWREGRHRHEVLSLAFVDWLFPRGHQDRSAVIRVIVAHHKDEAAIIGQYGSSAPTADQQKRLDFLVSQISEPVANDLWTWLVHFGARWQSALELPELEPANVHPRAALTTAAISRALGDFKAHLFGYVDQEHPEDERIRDVHYRGLILTADHAASAGADAFPALHLDRAKALPKASKPDQPPPKLKSHQQAADASAEGSLLLIAPTGSGKTEAAMLWAARQQQLRPAARIFYTLPYQASMNAMVKRLEDTVFNGEQQQVTVQHSRATLKFYQDAMEADGGANPRRAAQQAKQQRNLGQLNYFPVQVFSPYQMLKAAYSLKGYEALLVDYTHALFIFDEIHAYEPSRLALIITMMGWLRREFGARFLVMTATLPPTVRGALQTALDISDEAVITASPDDFAASQRHTVHLEPGDLFDALPAIHAEFTAGKRVLVTCNTVGRAQAAYRQLQDNYGLRYRDDMLLLHGRFNGKDRTGKEKLLDAVVGVGRPRSKPYIIVATQVVEVSLNIDLDTLYTDPAPLDALLQRFGRVNRGRGADAPLLPVHIFREPVGEKESKPYDVALVRAGLAVLERTCNGRPIDEAQVTAMLEQVYQQGEIMQRWQAAYAAKAHEFQGVLDRIQPFQSADEELFRAFYKLFEGTQVLPVDCITEYQNALEAHLYLEAMQLLVNVTQGQYHQMTNAKLNCGRDEHDLADHVKVDYSEEWGLDIAGTLARQQLQLEEDDA